MKEYHYYAFSFMYKAAGKEICGSVYWGLDQKKVTLAHIEKAKDAAKVPKGSVLISCSYLGYMTDDEFRG
jgi:hypothetical protein